MKYIYFYNCYSTAVIKKRDGMQHCLENVHASRYRCVGLPTLQTQREGAVRSEPGHPRCKRPSENVGTNYHPVSI